MKIEKIPEGYLLARKGGNGCELWRKFNGAESMACDAIDELLAERDALRAEVEAMKRQEPVDLNYIELMNSAQKIVESYVYFRRFIASTPLENDIAVWMADFVFAQLGAKGE